MYQVIHWKVIFACFIHKTDFDLKQRVRLEYILRHCTLTLWQIVLWLFFFYTMQTQRVVPWRDHSFSGIFWSSRTALTWLRLGIGVGPIGTCEHSVTMKAATLWLGVITPRSQRGKIFWVFQLGWGETKQQHTETRHAVSKWFVVSRYLKLLF